MSCLHKVTGLGARVVVAALITVATVGLPPTLAAQEPFYGTFHLLPEAGDDMEAVYDRGVSLVESWVKRLFARGRIAEVNKPFEWFQLFRDGDGLRINTPEFSITVPRGGTLEGWGREEGDPVDVSAEWSGDAWIVRFEAEDGTRVNRYALGPSGDTLSLGVTVTSGELRAPLEYELVFERR